MRAGAGGQGRCLGGSLAQLRAVETVEPTALVRLSESSPAGSHADSDLDPARLAVSASLSVQA